ncbi:MAG TPA: lysylphosphatidylglycerol synthase transmembrane domain-containing protein [Candidatus Krumholzibacteria bacterium]|nr:lysylphosphatidylglycerol synthase transmembrane domain-containing protein [Candidatus Krumholzibacteria bacterium]
MQLTAPRISTGKIRTGLQLFLAFSIVGFFIVFQRSSIGETIRHLAEFDLRYLGLALALVGLDWIVSATRIYIFARKVYRPITFGACMRSCFANVFLGGATPSQTGGAAAQIYVLYAEGMTVVDATVVCFLGGFLGTTIILLACAVIFSFIVHPDFVPAGLRMVSGLSFSVFAAILILVLLSLLSPNGMKRAVHGFLRRLPRLGPRLEHSSAIEKTFATVDRYHDLMVGFLIRGKLIFLAGLLLTAVIYINKFMIAWVVLKGIGVHADVWSVLYMQVILLLIFYFSPSPGASGFAEVTTMAVMGSVIPDGYEATFILLWRFFTLVLSMMVGAGVLMSYISGKRGRRRPSE